MKLFKYEGQETIKQDLSHKLLIEVTQKESTDEIKLTPKGKPYFVGGPEVSISHTGRIWMCAVSDTPVGLDVQEKRTVKYVSIAERFFTPLEADYIKKSAEGPKNAFYRIWARKEAYVKYTGLGFSETGFTNFCVLDDRGEPATHTTIDGEKICFTEIDGEKDLENKYICIICRKEENDDQIRIFSRE